jgi:hypothetical protein
MARSTHDLGILTIANGQTVSNVLSGAGVVQAALGSANVTTIFTPATLPETVNVEVAPVINPQAADWKRLQWQPGTDLVLAAARAVNIPLIAAFKALRIVASGAVAADRAFRVLTQVDSDSAF